MSSDIREFGNLGLFRLIQQIGGHATDIWLGNIYGAFCCASTASGQPESRYARVLTGRDQPIMMQYYGPY